MNWFKTKEMSIQLCLRRDLYLIYYQNSKTISKSLKSVSGNLIWSKDASDKGSYHFHSTL